MKNQKTKRMPSEHRITDLKEGQYQIIHNDFGTFILVNVPMEIDEERDYYGKPNHKVTVSSVCEALDEIDDISLDAHQEKWQDHAADLKA